MKAAARELGGRVQQNVGNFTGDAKTQAEGMYNQAAGQAQKAVGQMSDVIKEQPIAAVADRGGHRLYAGSTDSVTDR